MKKFLSKKRIIFELAFLALSFFILAISTFIFNIIFGEPLAPVNVYAKVINFSQEIKPKDPIKEVLPLEKKDQKEKKNGDLRSSDFRMISNIGEKEENIKQEGINFSSSIINFKGKAIYPNSYVLMQISSEPFIVSVLTDSGGNWNWTNIGQPLEIGEHSIETCNISPFDLSGKRDVYIQKSYFKVESEKMVDIVPDFFVEKSGYFEDANNNDFGDRFALNDPKDTYAFDISIINKRDFFPGDEINLLMLFNPVGRTSQKNAKVKYEVYHYTKNETDARLFSEFEDNFILNGESSFLKKITLEQEIESGNYFIKAFVDLGNDRYVQAVKFYVSSETLVQIGSIKVTSENLQKTVAMSIVIHSLAIMTILIVFVWELVYFFRRTGDINENILRKRGYFC